MGSENLGKSYSLTKSKIMAGMQCHKKLWFDINSPIKKDLHVFYIGNRFGELARQHYGVGVDLSRILDVKTAMEMTRSAILDLKVLTIYEAAFIHDETLVRLDVLRRVETGWEMIEVKSSTSLRDEHILDAAVQTYIASYCGVKITKVKISHINKDFLYKGDGEYSDLISEIDISEKIDVVLPKVDFLISQLKPVSRLDANCPKVSMGVQCETPHKCQYIERCDEVHSTPNIIPVNVLSHVSGSFIKSWAAQGINDLRDIPENALVATRNKVIQDVHKTGVQWISPDVKNYIDQFEWPRYFLDFETVQQGVPILRGTKPYDAVPFQYSVHRWCSKEKELRLNDAQGYLNFYSPSMDIDFIASLLNHLGQKGPIFVHNASFEKRILRETANRIGDPSITDCVGKLIERIIDTLEIARQSFYSPEMMGSYSLKSIVKSIPTTVNYTEKDGLGNGEEAQIAWHVCINPDTDQVKKAELENKLEKYCAKDTLAMYDFIRYLSK